MNEGPAQLLRQPAGRQSTPNQSNDLKEPDGHLIAVCKRCLHDAAVKPEVVIPCAHLGFSAIGIARSSAPGSAKRAASPRA